LSNNSVLINARTVTNNRVQIISNDGGLTFETPTIAPLLIEPLEGCEGSLIRDPESGILYFSDPNARSLVRHNMTIFRSLDEGNSWEVYRSVDIGSVAYSALQIIPSSSSSTSDTVLAGGGLEVLYERSNKPSLVFEPQEIRYWRVV
jgi:hypothetical protein